MFNLTSVHKEGSREPARSTEQEGWYQEEDFHLGPIENESDYPLGSLGYGDTGSTRAYF